MYSSYSTDSDTQIYLNPQLHNITTIIKMFTDPEHIKTSAGYDFTKYKCFFYGHNILTEGVFVTKLSGDSGVSSVTNCGLKQIGVS